MTIAQAIYDHLILPDPERVARTGSLTETTSLRHRGTRESLLWVKEHFANSGRLFTESMVKAAVTQLVEDDRFPFDLPATPGFEISSWIHGQAGSLHALLKRARKSTAAPLAMADNTETQPWSCMDEMPELDATQDSSLCMQMGWSSVSYRLFRFAFPYRPDSFRFKRVAISPLQDSQVALSKRGSSSNEDASRAQSWRAAVLYSC